MSILKNSLLFCACVTLLAANALADEPSVRANSLGDFQGQKLQPHDDFLAVDEAFELTALAQDKNVIALTWIIAPGYYLYRNRISVATDAPNVRLGAVALPRGQLKHDEYFGDTQVYYEVLDAQLPVRSPTRKIALRVTYQGCAEAGLCYNPVTKTIDIDLP
jgi:thioredoxin:protein disulfide reductase